LAALGAALLSLALGSPPSRNECNRFLSIFAIYWSFVRILTRSMCRRLLFVLIVVLAF